MNQKVKMPRLLRAGVCLAGGVVAIFPAMLARAADSDCVGTQTRLERRMEDVPSIPRMDQSIGKTRMVLRDKVSGKVRLDERLEGRWHCLGFNGQTGRYLLGGEYQRGAWLPLADIVYLPEDKPKLEASAFSHQGFQATAAVLSPQAGYIAFVGGQGSTGRLYLLDIVRDSITKLRDRAPLPPPASAMNRQTCAGIKFGWGECWGETYTDMDKGIIAFPSESRLVVSDGQDSPRRRAARRTFSNYALPAASLPAVEWKNDIEQCVSVRADAPMRKKDKVYLDAEFMVHKPAGDCGCTSMRVSYTTHRDDKDVLQQRRFALRESGFHSLLLGSRSQVQGLQILTVHLGCAGE